MKMKFVRVASLKDLKPASVSECEKRAGGNHCSTKERAQWVRHFLGGDLIAGFEPMDRSQCR
ncbi:MAG: hypothetical protein EBR88_00010 [Betaproteobacteria bacterium]|nr:hypothetical protein [Betaproteobacteria bacterium]